MAFHVYHRFGECEPNLPLDKLEALYDELQKQDDEHPDVSVEHESGWSLAALSSGLLVWENVEEGTPRHMKSVTRDKVLDLWGKLATGDIASIEAEAWQEGYR